MVKNPATNIRGSCHAGDVCLIPRLGRSLGRGNVNPLRYSCQDNPMDIEAWKATVRADAKSQTTELSGNSCTSLFLSCK